MFVSGTKTRSRLNLTFVCYQQQRDVANIRVSAAVRSTENRPRTVRRFARRLKFSLIHCRQELRLDDSVVEVMLVSHLERW